MSVYHPQTRIVDSGETFVAPGVSILAEGMALVRRNAAPAAGTQPAVGDGAEVFAGFSHGSTSGAAWTEQYAVKVEEFVVPASGSVTLARTPVTGQTAVYDIDTATAVASPTVVANRVTGLTAGDNVRVTYKFALTALEARSMYGNSTPGGFSGDYVGQVGLLKRGTLFTDQIDTSIDWTTVSFIFLAANGQISGASGNTAPTGKTLINGYVVSVPSIDYPFVAIEFSAA